VGTVVPRIGVRHLWLLVPFFALAVRVRLPIGDNSFLWHVRAGIDQIGSGEVIRSDPYSFTMAGEPWRTQSWLAELGYGFAENTVSGLGWVPWFSFIMASLVLGVVTVLVLTRRGSLASAAAVLIGVGWIFLAYANPRPVLLSYLMLALVTLVISSHSRALWALPAIMWVWAAVHGSFVIGLGVVVLDAIRRRSFRHVKALALSLVAVSLTAHGLGVWEILYRFARTRQGLDFIAEWQPPDFQIPWLLPFLAALIVLMVGFGTRRIPLDALWIIAPMVGFGLLSTRNVLPALIVMVPWLADSIAPFRDTDEVRRREPLAVVTAAALAVAALVFVATAPGLSETRFPDEASVAALAGERAFHDMGSGGYMIYAHPDDPPVFVDDRVELYAYDFLEEFVRASQGSGWESVFSTWDIHHALVTTGSPLAAELPTAGWATCHETEHFVVLAEVCG
jgi:hypothetical protein